MPYHRWKTQQEICRAILTGGADEAFAEHRVSTLDQAIYRRMANEIVAATIARHSPFRRFFMARIRNPVRIIIALAGLIAGATIVTAAMLLQWVDLSVPGTFPILGSAVGICAIGVAAIGWAVSAWIAHRNTRTKHTLDIVAARFAQPAFSEALRVFNKAFEGVRIDSTLIATFVTSDDDGEREAVQGLRYLLNFFEFISVGVLEGELDENIVRKTLRGNLRNVYDRSARYIIELQNENPATLEHFTLLRRHYEEL